MPKRRAQETQLLADLDYENQTLTLKTETDLTHLCLTTDQALILGHWILDKAIQLKDYHESQHPIEEKTLPLTKEGPNVSR